MPARDGVIPDEYEARWRQAHRLQRRAGGPLVGVWLRLVRRLAQPLVRVGVSPTAVTTSGLLLAIAAASAATLGGRWALVVALLVGLSALADGMDGAVALLAGRSSPWGSVVDAAADRLSELAFGVALWALGAPGWLAGAAVAVAWWHEYLRERAVSVVAGFHDRERGVGGDGGEGDRLVVLTVAERPTRVAVVAMFALAAGVLPERAAAWVTLGSAAWLLVGTVGLAQLVLAWARLPR